MRHRDGIRRTAAKGRGPMVELVDARGTRIGVASKDRAHSGIGRMHRAFSVLLLDAGGNLLIQRRAATKYHSPGLWSNTCCGHPFPVEEPSRAAIRRIREELGATIAADQLVSAGSLTYALTDPVSRVVEREFNHLFVGPAPLELSPDPAEVAEVAFVPLAAVDARSKDEFTVWFPLVLNGVRPFLSALMGNASSS